MNVLEKVRARWSDITLSVDANSAYTLDEFEHLRKFDQFNLLMIEQPLWSDDFYFHARLQKSVETAICLDAIIAQLSALGHVRKPPTVAAAIPTATTGLRQTAATSSSATASCS